MSAGYQIGRGLAVIINTGRCDVRYLSIQGTISGERPAFWSTKAHCEARGLGVIFFAFATMQHFPKERFPCHLLTVRGAKIVNKTCGLQGGFCDRLAP